MLDVKANRPLQYFKQAVFMLLFLFHEVWATSPNPPPSRLHCVHEKFILNKVQSSVQKTTIMKNEDVEKKQMEKTSPKKTVRQLLLT